MKFTIKELRARKSETQADVAQAVGVSVATYVNWEKSLYNIPIGKVAALADHFGVTLDDIFIA